MECACSIIIPLDLLADGHFILVLFDWMKIDESPK